MKKEELKEYKDLDKLELLKLKIEIGKEFNERLRQLRIRMEKTIEKLKKEVVGKDNHNENI